MANVKTEPIKKAVSVTEAARIIGFSRPTIQKWVDSGEIRAKKIMNKTKITYLIDRKELENFTKK